MWDTAGVERFRTITNSYYRGSHAAVLVYSVDEPSSLHYLAHWIQDLEEYAPSAKKILVGNKKDLKSQISTQTIEVFNNSNECNLSVLLSAKTGEGVQDLFRDTAQLLLEGHQQKISNVSALDLNNSSTQRKGSCCS